MAANTGAWLTSLTVMSNDSSSDMLNESVTRTVTVTVWPPKASPGVQTTRPVVGPICMPAGGVPTSDQVSVSVGRLGSVASTSTAKGTPSLAVWLGGSVITGGWPVCVLVTTTVKF